MTAAYPSLSVPSPLAALRRSRRVRVLAACLALCAYAVAGAIVPAGHMAAGLASGTPFHLCPGDLRSAQVLAALSASSGFDAASSHAHRHHHHHHRAGHHSATDHESGSHTGAGAGAGGGASVKKSSADAGCSFASGAVAVSDSAAETAVSAVSETTLLAPTTLERSRAAAWLRPPVRSPPV